MKLHCIENGKETVLEIDLPELPLIAAYPDTYKIFCHIAEKDEPVKHIYRSYSIGTDKDHSLIPVGYYEEAIPELVPNHANRVKDLLECIRNTFTLPE